MKRIPVRDFQLKPYECLKELPIMLTRYNKDVAVIQKASDLRDGSSEAEHLVVDQEAEVSKSSRPAEVKLCKHGRMAGLCEYSCK